MLEKEYKQNLKKRIENISILGPIPKAIIMELFEIIVELDDELEFAHKRINNLLQ